MGLSWQQGPLGRDPNGVFLTATPMPERVLYLEPLRRRMTVELGGSSIASSDAALILFEPARYPVAYFPIDDVAEAALQPSDRESTHPDLGKTRHAMDAFYEEDECILGHAADPYHRIDIRRTSRHLVVQQEDLVIADTHAPVVLYESGFAPRWYVPRSNIATEALHPSEGQTFCPYKGLASYYDVGDARNAAWSYRAPFEDVARIADLVSFYPKKLTIRIDGERLEEAPGQNVIAHGPDRNLSVDEVGGIQLVEDPMVAEA